MLALLDIQGATIIIDATGTQKAIARQISESGDDYILALKGNHPNLHEDVRLWMNTEFDHKRLEVLETPEKDHGRIEIRRYTLSRMRDGTQCAGHG